MKKITDYAELVKAKHALNKTIAPVEDGASMAGSYTSGKQFIRDSVLYSALTSIAAGTAWSSLALDTDYEVADDVSTQIAAVNQTLTQQADAMVNVLGAKNLLPNEATSKTDNGITFTVNSDGTVSVSGTATVNTYLLFPIISLKKGTYIISGCPDINQSETKAFLYIGSLSVFDYGNGKDFTLSSDNDNINVAIRVNEGASFSSVVTFKPMIRLASIEDDTYEPYSMTNQEMTPYVQAISNPNLLDNPWFTVNQRGQSRYTGLGYTYDRWYHSSADCVTERSNGVITLSHSSASWSVLIQRVEDDIISSLRGKDLTLSIMMANDEIKSITKQFPSSNPSQSEDYYSLQISNDALLIFRYDIGGFWDVRVALTPTANTSVSFKAIKLELGSVSTLAQDTAPNYQQELAKCQRYFCRIGGNSSGYPIALGRAHNATQGRYLIKLPVPMRANATVTFSNFTNVRELCNHQQSSPSSYDAGGMDAGGYLTLYTTTTGLVTDELCALMLQGEYMDVSADL